MQVSPEAVVKVGMKYRFKTFTFTSNDNCKAFYIPKAKYKRSKDFIQAKKKSGLIKDYLLIPFLNHDGCIALINY